MRSEFVQLHGRSDPRFGLRCGRDMDRDSGVASWRSRRPFECGFDHFGYSLWVWSAGVYQVNHCQFHLARLQTAGRPSLFLAPIASETYAEIGALIGDTARIFSDDCIHGFISRRGCSFGLAKLSHGDFLTQRSHLFGQVDEPLACRCRSGLISAFGSDSVVLAGQVETGREGNVFGTLEGCGLTFVDLEHLARSAGGLRGAGGEIWVFGC